MTKQQPLSAKIGEIKFRQKITRQHLGNALTIADEPDQDEILRILKERAKTTRKIFRRLKKRGICLSPFLEIGAEKGQRSMVLVNEFRAHGFALDLSFESLTSAAKFAPLLDFKKLPNLICSDAYSLPFSDKSFPFVFCFETLHHFPDPKPVVKEIHRVLTPGGVFYFGEEPVKQVFNLDLWRRGYHLTRFEKVLKAIGILPFISRIGKTEVNHGVLEEEFSLLTWEKALSVFEKVQASVQPVFFGPQSSLIKTASGWQKPNPVTTVLIAIQGGGISGLAIKKGSFKLPVKTEIKFICPDCRKAVRKEKRRYFCRHCQRHFVQKKGVLILLPGDLQKKLYRTGLVAKNS